MEWPACSPDMNPIEHVWDALGRRVAGRQLPPQTLQELERALLEEWDRIPQLMVNSLIDSMPQSSEYSAICEEGGNTTVFFGVFKRSPEWGGHPFILELYPARGWSEDFLMVKGCRGDDRRQDPAIFSSARVQRNKVKLPLKRSRFSRCVT
ncbi:transposable element Tcb2 transposase [Trichonephila clavipes]|nr:transposable element Tcb2 transposase [Trichonephila clavipes]